MQFLAGFTAELIVASPGRINLIGEHTDYNLGFVLPTAIDKRILFSFQKNGSDSQCNIYSKDLEIGFKVDLKTLKKSDVTWENYILGVLHEISKRTTGLSGFDCIIESHIPMGSGISSSAALECGLAFGLNTLLNLKLSLAEIVLLSRDAEHKFVGTKCGIMDQYASVMSKKGNVILLDCEAMTAQHIPIAIAPYKLLLLNSNVSHTLASSAYNQRREECEEGVRILRAAHPQVNALRHVTPEMLVAHQDKMPAKVFDRCSYVVAENGRVIKAVEALKAGDMEGFGTLLYETHHGLQTLYEVSCEEIDFLVDFTKQYPQVLGARLMGGGFGGCTLNIVHEDQLTTFVKENAPSEKHKS